MAKTTELHIHDVFKFCEKGVTITWKIAGIHHVATSAIVTFFEEKSGRTIERKLRYKDLLKIVQKYEDKISRVEKTEGQKVIESIYDKAYGCMVIRLEPDRAYERAGQFYFQRWGTRNIIAED